MIARGLRLMNMPNRTSSSAARRFSIEEEL
jgi:hypothetical protein